MPPLPRKTCPLCGRNVAIRRRGEFREHQTIAGRKCPGSGKDSTGTRPGLRRALP